MPTTEPTHTWESVLALVPPPTPEQSALYALDTDPAELVELGARIRSEKILTDLVRWSGQVAEFMPKATPAQRRLLLGYSDAFFRVTVHEGKKLRGMLESRTGNTDDREAKRVAAIATAAKAYSDGLDERDRLENALKGLRRYDTTLDDRITQALGRVVDAPSLDRSLKALTALARDLLSQPTSILALQLADGGVTPAELDTIDKAGDDAVRTAKAADGARQQGPVTQSELDQQDGTCLAHMARLMRIFDGAHAKDPKVPHLVANATRSLLSPTRKRSQTAEAPPPPPAPAAPSPLRDRPPPG